MNVPELLAGRRVCVCAGSGGVGKTTTSAAIALGMATEGAKVAVVTIDPARRLANALGLEELQNEPRQVDPDRLGSLTKGELWAMMLDPKRTFDELIERVAPSPQRAEEIKANGVYRELSTAVSGSQEFTAISKLHELASAGYWDLLVLDTPPSRNALDFFDAPTRLTSFLEGRALKAFLRPTGLGMKMLGFGAAPLLGGLRRITGVDLLTDLTTFFGLLGGMTEDFTARAKEVDALLHSEDTAFLLVTSAEEEPIDEAVWFRRTLHEQGLPFAGVVVNRFHHELASPPDADALRAALGPSLPEGLLTRIAANAADYHVLARRDAASVARLEAELDEEPLLLVPHFDDDVHDVEGLRRVRNYLFASDGERATMIERSVA